MGFWLLTALVVALPLWAVIIYNRLVRLRNQVRTAWADIDVQLARRHDLVPQLVAAVKGYAGHEKALLETATELRSRALAETSPARLGDVESALEQASFSRRIEEAEQELWTLTSADAPDAAKIEAKVRAIEALRGDQRLAFIRAVGEAAEILSDEQRRSLLGQLPPQNQPMPPQPAAPAGVGGGGMGDM